MKENISKIIIAAVVVLLVIGVMLTIYMTSDTVRSVFDGGYSVTPTTVEVPQGTEAEYAEAIEAAKQDSIQHAILMGHISQASLIFVTVLQVLAFLLAVFTFRSIRKSEEPVAVRLSKLENADLFLDLPLYFGLFGTVLSFSLITFNPQISRLIAYSSTLIGIIFSVLLRLFLQYPLKQKLLGMNCGISAGQK